MKKRNISRRNFMKGLTAGALTVSLVPAWALENRQNSFGEMNQLPETYLPKLFDCNKYIGPGFPTRPDFMHANDLVGHLDRLGVDRAVAWHTSAREINPMVGNVELIREINGAGAQGRIIPSFIITPTLINDPGVMAQFLDFVKTNNIHSFHFFPKKFKWSLLDIAPVIRAILPYNPVLFLDSFENLGNNMDILLNFSLEFPQVNIIFTNAMWPHYKSIFELMEARPNICMDTSLIHTYRTTEQVIERFGAERLIFGAGYKSNNGASIAALAHAEISSRDAQLIAHNNLEALLKIESPLSGTKLVAGDKFWHRFLRREHLGLEVIDAHTHHTHGTLGWDDPEPTDMDGFVRHSLKSMDQIGVKTMIVAETEVYLPDLEGGMTYMEKHLSPHGNRFHGYFPAIAFTSEYAGKIIPRLDEFFSRSYYVGFKTLNDYWKIPVTDPCFIPMWEYANSHRLPILLHTWEGKYDAPGMLRDIAPRYPNATFILGHSGSNDRPDAEKLVQENPNVYLEWCGSFVNPTDWGETLERLGNRRLVYGSDGISWEKQWGHNPVWEMGRLLSLDVSDETLMPILGDNMRSVLAKKC